MLSPEKISHKHLTDLSTSPVKFSHFTYKNTNKSLSAVLFINTLDYLRYFRRKQTVTHLPTTLENITTLTCDMQNFYFYLTDGLLRSFE